MLRKTMLSKILSTAIAAITVVSPLGVSANPTSSQGDKKNSPETTKVSSQETFANPDLIPPSVPPRKRKSTGSITSSTKRAKSCSPVKLPYNVIISFDNSNKFNNLNENATLVLVHFNCKATQPTEEQKDLMEKFCKKITYLCDYKLWEPPFLKREYSLNDIINSKIIIFKERHAENTFTFMKELKNIITYISSELNIKFDNIELNKE